MLQHYTTVGLKHLLNDGSVIVSLRGTYRTYVSALLAWTSHEADCVNGSCSLHGSYRCGSCETGSTMPLLAPSLAEVRAAFPRSLSMRNRR